MEVKFLKHDVYFISDKESRDIFKITFKRNVKQFSITFGQSISESTGYGDNPPNAYDVLSCIEKYDTGSFDDFVNNFGYNDQSLSEYRGFC